MRHVARLTLCHEPPPPPSIWAVRSAEHLTALRRVADVLTAMVATLTRGRVDLALLPALGGALDAAVALARPGGTPHATDPAEARRLLLLCDHGKTLMTQLRALARCDRHERATWEDRIAATLGEVAALTPRQAQAG